MILSNAHARVLIAAVFLFPALFLFSGCDEFLKEKPRETPLARVGESYLYLEDIQPKLTGTYTATDSIAFVNNLINEWATRQLLLSKARINLPEEQLKEFELLISDYRAELFTRAYKEALVAQIADTLVGEAELLSFYEKEKENFKLQEKILQLRFIEIPQQFINQEEVTRRLKSFEGNDLHFLDSVGVQFKKLHFNDSLWVPLSRVVEEIQPLTYE
ncbi:MAG: peptidyl-prolyl cis-trans isomerase, partial [Robiginitalea sp.]